MTATDAATPANGEIVNAIRSLKAELDEALAAGAWNDRVAELVDIGEQLGDAVQAAKLLRLIEQKLPDPELVGDHARRIHYVRPGIPFHTIRTTLEAAWAKGWRPTAAGEGS